MRRFVALLGLVVLPVLGLTAPAGAVGYGVCTVTGTIAFSPQADAAGAWKIAAAVIDCQGLIAARRRIIGRGPFKGSGSFTSISPAAGACSAHTGTGTVDYTIPTSGGTILVTETIQHSLAGVGVFETPTLRGPFQLAPPYDGDCLTKPAGKANFVAEVVLYRYPRELPKLR